MANLLETGSTAAVADARSSLSAGLIFSSQFFSGGQILLNGNSSMLTEVKRPLRLLLVDDHEAVRRGLRSAIWAAGWDVCAEASDGREAIEKAREFLPDVVILDVSMPVMGGFEAAPEILKASPGTKIVAFTMHESEQAKNEMKRIGFHGMAVKSAPLSNLLDTIKSVVAK
jgi:DNA-binding NarL/FixJ family response regulator